MNQERAEIDKQRERWIVAINEADPAGFVAVLTDDAVWLPSGQDALSGREQIRAWLEPPFSEFEYNYSVSDVRLRLAGEWAIEQASFTTRAQKKSGEAMPKHEGRYTLLWRKSPGGTWLIERYIDHTADAGKE